MSGPPITVDVEMAYLRGREEMRRHIRDLEARLAAADQAAAAWRKRARDAEAEVERLHTEANANRKG